MYFVFTVGVQYNDWCLMGKPSIYRCWYNWDIIMFQYIAALARNQGCSGTPIHGPCFGKENDETFRCHQTWLAEV